MLVLSRSHFWQYICSGETTVDSLTSTATFFLENSRCFKNICIFAVSFYHTAQVTKTVSVDVFDSDVQ